MKDSASSPFDEPERDSPVRDTRIVLVNAHEIVRAGLACLLEHHRFGANVVGEAVSSRDALDVVAETRPELVITDYALADSDAPDLVSQIKAHWPRQHTLVLSEHDSVHYAVRALRAGATGYVVTDDQPAIVAEAIRETANGRRFVTDHLADEVERRLQERKRRREGLDTLSPREFQLLRYIVGGHSLGEAALRMGVSDSSVSTYRRRLMDKLDAESNAHLVRIAMSYGITGDDPR